jgi:hypothetical protein
MGIQKSELDFYIELFRACHRDVASQAYPVKEHARDASFIGKRLISEGLSFLTKTLPKLGKAIDFALSHGQRLDVPGFRKKPGSSLPRFLGSLLEQVFTPEGYERSDASVSAIMQLRQLCYLLYRLELPYDESTKAKVLTDFVVVDDSLRSLNLLGDTGEVGKILSTASRLVNIAVGSFDPRKIHPRHGPGAVATGEKAWQKMTFKRYYRRLSRFYPYEDNFYYNLTHLTDDLGSFLTMGEFEAGMAKVILVPKDSRGPRLISCEPLEYQWIQQGLGRALMSHIEANAWTRGRVNFTLQSVNQALALEGSRTQKYATLDMKEASDRVSLELVYCLFQNHPVLMEALYATRSASTRLPGKEIVELNKFAPMGSALCFPVEALCFWAISVAAVSHHRRISLREAAQDVYVYGDDIITLTEDHGCVITALESVGLLANYSKCCVAGFFRESCGVDAFKGINVTPMKIRKRYCPDSPRSLASWSCYQQDLDKRGYTAASLFLQSYLLKEGIRYVDRYYTEHERREITIESEHCSALIFISSLIRPDDWSKYRPYPSRFHKGRHRRVVLGPVLSSTRKSTGRCDWSEMLRKVSQPSPWVIAGLYPVRRRVTLKRRWMVVD